MDMFTRKACERIEEDSVFRRVEEMIDWKAVARKAEGVRSHLGRAGHDVDMMIRVILLGAWHSLSDRELERRLRVRLDFMPFCGVSALDDSPDHTTICRFRNALVEAGLNSVILEEVDRQLTERGLKVKGGRISVVDATVIESAARPGNPGGRVAVDRAEEGTDGADGTGPTGRVSADPDARWLKKGRKTYFGCKAFRRTNGAGCVEHVLVRPANEGEAPHLESMVEGCAARRVLADRDCSSAANREMLADRGKRSGIMFRAARDHPLGPWRKFFNRLVSKLRWIVEQCFGTFKRLFDGARARYMTIGKVEAAVIDKAMAMNLPRGRTAPNHRRFAGQVCPEVTLRGRIPGLRGVNRRKRAGIHENRAGNPSRSAEMPNSSLSQGIQPPSAPVFIVIFST